MQQLDEVISSVILDFQSWIKCFGMTQHHPPEYLCHLSVQKLKDCKHCTPDEVTSHLEAIFQSFWDMEANWPLPGSRHWQWPAASTILEQLRQVQVLIKSLRGREILKVMEPLDPPDLPIQPDPLNSLPPPALTLPIECSKDSGREWEPSRFIRDADALKFTATTSTIQSEASASSVDQGADSSLPKQIAACRLNARRSSKLFGSYAMIPREDSQENLIPSERIECLSSSSSSSSFGKVADAVAIEGKRPNVCITNPGITSSFGDQHSNAGDTKFKPWSEVWMRDGTCLFLSDMSFIANPHELRENHVPDMYKTLHELGQTFDRHASDADEGQQIDALLSEVENVHTSLLRLYAPSPMQGVTVDEKLREQLQKDKGLLQRLLVLFIETDRPQNFKYLLSPECMRHAARKWLSGGYYIPQATVSYLAVLSGDHLMTKSSSYYDYLKHMLGIGWKRHPVRLFQYDISGGKADWLSPYLTGDHLEGIWHTSIVVFDREYWYGGSIFEGNPVGSTPFGKPVKIIDLGETVRDRHELLSFIQSDLLPRFTRASYDVFSNNCNHFTDTISLFLIGKNIPHDILSQPNKIMSTRMAKVLVPALNQLLCRFAKDNN